MSIIVRATVLALALAAGCSGRESEPGGSGGEAGGTGSEDSIWRPPAGITWDWQLDSEDLDLSHDVDVYDLDWEVSEQVVSDLHDQDLHVICYVSVGSWEEGRPDADDFPEEAIGNEYPGWPDERFVDIRSEELREVMEARFDVCQEKGFDAIEPDNQDVFEADSGFALSEEDGLEYARWLAEQAHRRGLGIVQKNTSSLTEELVSLYQGVLTEDCFADGWCDDVLAYVDADKPVLMAEYTDTDLDLEDACAYAEDQGYSLIQKDRDLTEDLTTCE